MSGSRLASLVLGAFAHAAEPLTFARHDLDSQNPGQVSEGMNVGDLDGDGRPDIIEGGEDALVWYHNPDWTPAPIATGFRYSAGAMVAVRDMDGDGRLDVVTGRYPVGQDEARETLWFEKREVPGCADEAVQPAIERRLLRACALIARASGVERSARLRRKAAGALRAAGRRAARAASRGHLSVRCARAFGGLQASVPGAP
jgi:hypothetical protein